MMALYLFVGIFLGIYFSFSNQETNFIRFLSPWNNTFQTYLYRNPYDYFLSTKSCFIPDYSRTITFSKRSKPIPCSQRIVSIDPHDHKVTFKIDYSNMKKPTRNRLQCCYNFLSPVLGDMHVEYDNCKPFNDGETVLQEDEILEIACYYQTPRNMTILHYKHTYQIHLKLLGKTEQNNAFRASWNVLMIGMEGMSRVRAYLHMPYTTTYMRKQGWLDFKANFKTSEDTFTNIMTILTGKNAATINEMVSEGFHNTEFIWDKYRNADYFTAFGEHNALHPNTLFKGHLDPQVDHVFHKTINEPKHGKMICSKKESLEYATQFANIYKNHKFFGLFWFHTIHNFTYTSLSDEKIFVSFFKRLQNDGILNTTFVILFSDSGMRYGKERITKEAHYDNKLPMLFIWVPKRFREEYPKQFENLKTNQERLITHYDLHATLLMILRESGFNVAVKVEACKDCQGLLTDIPKGRTCHDAFLEERWCSCFEMVNRVDKIGLQNMMELVMNEINSLIQTIVTKHCTICSPLALKSVVRFDWYKSGDKKYYDIVFKVYQKDISFEVKVEQNNAEYNILFPIENLTPNTDYIDCVTETESVLDFALQSCVCVEDVRCKHINNTYL